MKKIVLSILMVSLIMSSMVLAIPTNNSNQKRIPGTPGVPVGPASVSSPTAASGSIPFQPPTSAYKVILGQASGTADMKTGIVSVTASPKTNPKGQDNFASAGFRTPIISASGKKLIVSAQAQVSSASLLPSLIGHVAVRIYKVTGGTPENVKLTVGDALWIQITSSNLNKPINLYAETRDSLSAGKYYAEIFINSNNSSVFSIKSNRTAFAKGTITSFQFMPPVE